VQTFDLNQAADFLKINSCTAQKMAAAGELPGAKIGRAWVFFEDDLASWLREQVKMQQKQRCTRYSSAITSSQSLTQASPPYKPRRGKHPKQPPKLPELPG